MKTYKQFVTEARELDEGLGTAAKIAMKGMKKRLTSAKTARDPDSRINKALRRWNC